MRKISRLSDKEEQNKRSLTYDLKFRLTHGKVLPPDHQDIGKSLANVGECYEHLNQPKLALDYYKQALIIYEQCLSCESHNQLAIELKIKQIGAINI
jgi:tetratricopeptide (TPR) repeat protein